MASVSLADETFEDIVAALMLSDTQEPEIHAVCRAGDHENLDKLLKLRNHDINEYDMYGCVALHYAAQSGFYDCLQSLINNGADVDLKTKDSYAALTAFEIAVLNRHYDCAVALVDAGTKYAFDNIDLLNLTLSFDLPCFVELIASRLTIDINTRDRDGLTAVCRVARQNLQHTMAILDILVRYGADVNATVVYSSGDFSFIHNAYHGSKTTALHIATLSPNIKAVQALANHGANPDWFRDKNGDTARDLCLRNPELSWILTAGESTKAAAGRRSREFTNVDDQKRKKIKTN